MALRVKLMEFNWISFFQIRHYLKRQYFYQPKETQFCQIQKHYYCNESSGNSYDILKSDREKVDDRNIPRRVMKRLRSRGLSKEDVIQVSQQKKNVEESNYSDTKLKTLVNEMVVEQSVCDFPSDREDYLKNKRDQSLSAFRPKVNPANTSLVLFPGQGSQFVGMGEKLLDYNGVKDLYEMASDVLGYDLLDKCLNGPKSELDKTVICQPAVFVTSVAAIEKLHELHPEVINNCTGTAGFSVGEYSALVFSGMLTFRDALKVVHVRAKTMQQASEMTPSGMMTVFIGHNSKLNFAMLAAREYCTQKLQIPNPVCSVANYLYSDCKVIAGHEEALRFIEDNKHEFNIKRTKRLPVSGAFHTPLMEEARAPVIKLLKGLEFKKPLFRVHSNVTTQRYHSSREVIKLLSKQIVKPVKWEQTLHMLYSRKVGENFPNTFEVGPGKQMGTLLKLVNLKAYKQYENIEV